MMMKYLAMFLRGADVDEEEGPFVCPETAPHIDTYTVYLR